MQATNNSFVAGFFLDDTSICDELIDFFETSKNKTRGTIGKNIINTDIKDSVDLCVDLGFSEITRNYANQLEKCLQEYIYLYPEINDTSPWAITSKVNIQKYSPGGGYKRYHYERDDYYKSTRFLTFMTFLNDVTDGGGTVWKYQNIDIQAEKGLTVFWPTDFTHLHRGVVSQSQTKYIITGWYDFVPYSID